MKSVITAIGLGLIVSLCACVPSGWCWEKPATGAGQWLTEVGIVLSYTEADLKLQDDFTSIPVGARLGFDLKPFLKKFGIQTQGLAELIYEPFIGAVTGPDDNVELGLPVILRYSFPLMSRLLPYVEVGTGPFWMSFHAKEEGSQFAFINYGGGGLTYFLNEHWALSAGYRWRHISNAGIAKPNAGIDAHMYTASVAYFF